MTKPKKNKLVNMTEVVIEIYKTNVRDKQKADKLISLLEEMYPKLRVNIDLEDCDSILRIQGSSFSSKNITEILNKAGYYCERIE